MRLQADSEQHDSWSNWISYSENLVAVRGRGDNGRRIVVFESEYIAHVFVCVLHGGVSIFLSATSRRREECLIALLTLVVAIVAAFNQKK